jgi:membrane-bound serine protease (ClpP class)
MTAAICLLLIGLGFVLAEVFFPSLGVFGLTATGCLVMAVIAGFGEGRVAGWSVIGAEVVLIPLSIKWGFQILPKLPFGRRMILQAPTEDPGAALPDYGALLHHTGTALTDLRPGGIARFEQERVSVVSLDGMLDEGTPLLVTEVEGAEVRVRVHRRNP